MYYAYILLSRKSHRFYFGSAKDLRERVRLHNAGRVPSTKYGMPWKTVWYGGFSTEKEARDFEQYLKNGSGKSFAYKRLIPVAVARDFAEGRAGSPKRKA
ncbi:GIY-YIG nuclease family protein [Candidatus Wolfebacteria bacterium]|nr:GIY-YIG nuclease family protein [Candidatus Wolfebacteria bacterium]